MYVYRHKYMSINVKEWRLISKGCKEENDAVKRREEEKNPGEDKQKVKLVKLLETGSDDGVAGPSPVISLSHFLDDVSNQWKPVAGHSITQLSSTTENI